jgi:tetratricopeptide (TPR) repeat protein
MARAASVGLAALTVASSVLGLGWLITRDPPFDYGIHTGEVRALSERLAAEPCAQPDTLKLTETMLRAGDYRGTLKRANAYFEKCGEWSRLLWVTYSAHERLSEHKAAVIDAGKLIREQPNDKDFWWWRAMAYEEMGELDKAVDDYRKALEVEPRLTGIPFNLANVLERQGKPCQAREPILQFLKYHPDVNNRDTIEARLDRLQVAGSCGQTK